MNIGVFPPETKIRARQTRWGFTLMELLVVIAIIGLLAGILIPVVMKAITRAKTTQCKSNLRQIGAGLCAYMADNKGVCPLCLDNTFRASSQYGLAKILEPYLPFVFNKTPGGEEWVDSRNTCPLYRTVNGKNNPKGWEYGSYAYQHDFSGDKNPPQSVSGNLSGKMITILAGDHNLADKKNFKHWSPAVYGIVWDTGWTEDDPPKEPRPYKGMPAHPPAFHVLFADMHVGVHEWVHRDGKIPIAEHPNVPPEFRY
jgi:prepilin-type N-terminal cleavage/methylation domain-containing protein